MRLDFTNGHGSADGEEFGEYPQMFANLLSGHDFDFVTYCCVGK